MKLSTPLLLSLCLSSIAFSKDDTEQQPRTVVQKATIKFAGLLRVCDIELRTQKPFFTTKDPWDQTIHLRIHYHRSVSSSRLIKVADDALAQEFSEQTNQQFRLLTQTVHDAYVDVEKGDTYALTFSPSKGLKLMLNDQLAAHVPDPDFATYYLRIWLGNNRMASSIKEKLAS